MTRRLKILYLNCHEILEYDDLRMLTGLGHSVFSLGEYSNPKYPGLFRRPSSEFFDETSYSDFVSIGATGPEGITREFASRFDVAIVNHDVNWAIQAVEYMDGKPVIYRSIGQSTQKSEAALSIVKDKITIVRYAEGERNLPGFLQADRVIYFCKFVQDFEHSWIGGARITTFHNSYPARSFASVPDIESYETLAGDLPFDLWGAGNEAVTASRGLASPDQQVDILRNSSTYFYVPTVPPSYTLSFIEAMGVGLPIVAPTPQLIVETISPQLIQAADFTKDRYEVPLLLRNDARLLYSSLEEAKEKFVYLGDHAEDAHSISADLRKTFADTFAFEKVGPEWNNLLMDLC